MLRALRTAADRRRHSQGAFAGVFAPYQGDAVMALDCETTTADPSRAELVSIAAVEVDKGRIYRGDALQIRLRAPASLSGDSIRIHRLRPVDLEEGEAVEQALKQLLAFIGNRPLVGWCIRYDIQVLNRYLQALLGFSLPNQAIDVASLYQRQQLRQQPELAPDLRFEAIARSLAVPVLARHTALGDAVTAGLMYLRLQARS